MPSPTHRLSHTHVYRCWASMNQRCRNKNTIQYRYYGGRGITVCDKWKDFSGFLEDMGMPPDGEHTIDRIDNEKGYFLGNCRWLNRRLQSRGRRVVRLFEFRGELLTIGEWSIKTGIPERTIANRIAAGWTINTALTKKTRGGGFASRKGDGKCQSA